MLDDSLPSIFPCTHPRCPYSWCAEIPEETAEAFRLDRRAALGKT